MSEGDPPIEILSIVVYFFFFFSHILASEVALILMPLQSGRWLRAFVIKPIAGKTSFFHIFSSCSPRRRFLSLRLRLPLGGSIFRDEIFLPRSSSC